MEWEIVKIETNQKGRTMPYASVGFGRMTLSSAACDLIKNCEMYSYVELLRGKENGKMVVGVRFIYESERTSNSIPIKRRKDNNGRYIKGIDISSKGAIESLFGMTGSANKATRFEVKKDKDFENILIVSAE